MSMLSNGAYELSKVPELLNIKKEAMASIESFKKVVISQQMIHPPQKNRAILGRIFFKNFLQKHSLSCSLTGTK